MGKRDWLSKHFRKDRAPTPAIKTPNVSRTKSGAAPTQSAPITQGSISAKRPEVNPALQLAFQKHLDDLPEADKDVFREECKQISQDSLLLRIKAFDDDHKSSSSFRPRAKDISKFLGLLNRFIAGIYTAIQANPDPSLIVVGLVQVVTTLASPLLWERMGTNMSLNIAILIGHPEGY